MFVVRPCPIHERKDAWRRRLCHHARQHTPRKPKRATGRAQPRLRRGDLEVSARFPRYCILLSEQFELLPTPPMGAQLASPPVVPNLRVPPQLLCCHRYESNLRHLCGAISQSIAASNSKTSTIPPGVATASIMCAPSSKRRHMSMPTTYAVKRTPRVPVCRPSHADRGRVATNVWLQSVHVPGRPRYSSTKPRSLPSSKQDVVCAD